MAATLAAVTMLAGCGGEDRPTPPGSVAREVDLTGATFTVGSKGFVEQLILCQMTIALLRSTGAAAVDRCDTEDSPDVRGALLGGRVDLYWEYTSTGWISHLGNTSPIQDPEQQYIGVRDQDLERNGVVWLPPAPFDDTYGIATTRAFAQQNGLRTLSDWANFVNSGNPLATTCVESGFATGGDGVAGLFRTYGVTDPPTGPPQLTTVAMDDVYRAAASGNPCHFGEVFTTDGRLRGLDLVTLQDDRDYFPEYNASPTIRREVFDQHPTVRRVFDALTPRLTDEVMLDLNARVASQGEVPAEVADGWLRQQGLIGGDQ
ncbi:glycine betaine ABC transporter substrate-binding protein [Actinomycetospora sp. CA-101289]|uniref:glycine betaine ABC transporter substrate-binding protein n=1 Tax=Actinomycetospora sp. CA-101289 TaxID=3239893 RepID=UPI003D99F03A